MDNAEVTALINKIDKARAQRKIGYWKTVGTALLDDDELSEKWCVFVEQRANDDFACGALLDESLQVMSMIKSKMSSEVIAQTIKQIPSGQIILSSYLGAFIHQDILSDIQSHMDSKKL